MCAAAKCIRDVFPNCEIIPNRTNAYPLRVIITVEVPEGDAAVLVWSGKQQNLFEKCQNTRRKCMHRIKSKLTGLRELEEKLPARAQVAPTQLLCR